MCRMLLSLTYFYEQADVSNYPRINVIFNGRSRHRVDQKGMFSSDSESDEKGDDKKETTWIEPAELILQYKKLICDMQFKEFQGIVPMNKIEAKVDEIFPEKNFYFIHMY